MTNKIEPIGKRVLAKKNEEKEQVVNGLIMPDIAKYKKYDIEVIAIGSEVTKVKVGDKISITNYGTKEIKHDDEIFMILPEEDILAILHD
jgi:co-chaperonin GroES (HSP10)